MFRFFFWRFYKKPQIGETYRWDDGDPFSTKTWKVLESRDGWIKRRWSYGVEDTVDMQAAIAFYRRVL